MTRINKKEQTSPGHVTPSFRALRGFSSLRLGWDLASCEELGVWHAAGFRRLDKTKNKRVLRSVCRFWDFRSRCWPWLFVCWGGRFEARKTREGGGLREAKRKTEAVAGHGCLFVCLFACLLACLFGKPGVVSVRPNAKTWRAWLFGNANPTPRSWMLAARLHPSRPDAVASLRAVRLTPPAGVFRLAKLCPQCKLVVCEGSTRDMFCSIWIVRHI